jgi:hypothetical protein
VLLHLLFVVALQSCTDASDCRRQATEALARGEYEQAHDLAWRAMQKTRPNDPEVMLVLARSQSLSGRAGDALVMLRRLADLGAAPKVADDPDFARVRALSGWPELEAKLAGAAPSSPPAPAPSAPATSAAPAPSSSSSSPRDSLAFNAPSLTPIALAHDAVSRRFLIVDRVARRLLVVDDESRNVANYVSAESAGFYDELTGFAIDPRRGDLWVASTRGDGDERASVIHKLQLISGRALLQLRPPDRAGAVRVVALAVTPDGTVYALDDAGGRLYRARAGSRSMELVMTLKGDGHAALAAAGDNAIYVGGGKQLLRVDPAARAAVPVKSNVDLGAFASLAWHGGGLIGIERIDGGYAVVRVRLDASGTRAVSRQILTSSPTATVGALGGDSYYYTADAGTIRKLTLR